MIIFERIDEDAIEFDNFELEYKGCTIIMTVNSHQKSFRLDHVDVPSVDDVFKERLKIALKEYDMPTKANDLP